MYLNKSNPKDIQEFNVVENETGFVIGREIDVNNHLYGILYFCDDFHTTTYSLDNATMYCGIPTNEVVEELKKRCNCDELKVYKIEKSIKVVEEIF